MSRPNRENSLGKIFGGIKTAEADFVNKDRTSRHGQGYDPERFHLGHSAPNRATLDSTKPPSAKPAHTYIPSRPNFAASRETVNSNPLSRSIRFGNAANMPGPFHPPPRLRRLPESKSRSLSRLAVLPPTCARLRRSGIQTESVPLPRGLQLQRLPCSAPQEPRPNLHLAKPDPDPRSSPPTHLPTRSRYRPPRRGKIPPPQGITDWDGNISPSIPVIGVDTEPEESHASAADGMSVVSASADGRVIVSVRGDYEEEEMAFERFSMRGDESNKDEPMSIGPGTLSSVGVGSEGWNASGNAARTRNRGKMPPPPPLKRPATANPNVNANPVAPPTTSSTTDSLNPALQPG